MKKIITIFISLIMLFSTFATACSSTSIDPEKLEISNIYREVAYQLLNKAGLVAVGGKGASPFSVSVADKKTETDDEHAIQNIKANAKDAAGIMYLLSLLYTSEGFEVKDGIACFDVNYSFQGEDVFQTMNMKSSIDKQNNKVYFEVMVITPKHNSNSYTNAEFTYNFNTSTLIDCRFIMNWDETYLDMMLTHDQKYMWYETETPDEFTADIDQLIEEFNDKCQSVQKLTTNFGDQMTAYLEFSFSVQENPNPQKPGQGGDGSDIVIGEGTIDKDQTTIKPEDAQVTEEIWNQNLNFTQIDKIAYTIDERQETFVISSIHYEFDGDKACKNIIDYQTSGTAPIFYSKDGNNYYRYDIEKTDIDMRVTKVPISEIQYTQEIGKVKIDFSSIFKYENFIFDSQINAYILSSPMENVNYVAINFYKNEITAISIISEGKEYQISNFHINEITLEIPN